MHLFYHQLIPLCFTHDIHTKLEYLENFKKEKMQLAATSDISPSVVFRLVADEVNKYNSWIGYNKMGQNATMLRLKSVEIISAEAGKEKLEEIAMLFTEFCQRLNQKEDEQYFTSLDEKKSISIADLPEFQELRIG